METRKLAIGGFFLLVLGVCFSLIFSMTGFDAAPVSESRVVIGGVPVEVTIVRTPEERERGLSGTASLPEGHGMFFVFEEDGVYSFWMKDMYYPIDIIWISRQNTVVDIAASVPPESYPTSFTPGSPARYVLEVPAEFAEQHGIGVGSKVEHP